jgi:N,N'-diacetylchitobiose transport system substrate-binding protein
MKGRTIGVVALAAVSVAVLAGGSSAALDRSTATLTVWLQVDAQAPNWEPIVRAANAEFERQHPGVNVNVQYQTWGTHLQKFDATLAGGNAPDVIEMGNTEMTKYMAAGAFQDLQKGSFPNANSWLKGLEQAGSFNGKLYGVPYYAGSRVVTYRTDLFRRAGINRLPRSLADFTAQARKLGRRHGARSFSPVYVAGTDWYFAMSFVYDYGGQIATRVSGKWKGTLSQPKALAGLAAYKRFFEAASRASKTTDESHPQPYDVYAQGRAASIIGPGWFSCCTGKFKGVTQQFVMPSHTPGLTMPGFLGGSNLAVPIGANKSLGSDWISIYTSTASQRALQGIGNIPNTTSLLGRSVNERAAARSWFVPSAKHWVNVENGNILRNMLAQILTGKLTIQQAASSASDNITSVLNAP